MLAGSVLVGGRVALSVDTVSVYDVLIAAGPSVVVASEDIGAAVVSVDDASVEVCSMGEVVSVDIGAYAGSVDDIPVEVCSPVDSVPVDDIPVEVCPPGDVVSVEVGSDVVSVEDVPVEVSPPVDTVPVDVKADVVPADEKPLDALVEMSVNFELADNVLVSEVLSSVVLVDGVVLVDCVVLGWTEGVDVGGSGDFVVLGGGVGSL